jgi:antitoxin CcdA
MSRQYVSTEAHLPKKAVNLTLSPAVVNLAKAYTTNLSATVEALLVDFVNEQAHAKQAKYEQVRGAMAEWNTFNDAVGSFANEYSTL